MQKYFSVKIDYDLKINHKFLWKKWLYSFVVLGVLDELFGHESPALALELSLNLHYAAL